MPRYFFDLYDDLRVQDAEGQDLLDLNAAKIRALKEARQIIAASVTDLGRIDLSHSIRVRDATGLYVALVEFDDAVSVRRGGEPV